MVAAYSRVTFIAILMLVGSLVGLQKANAQCPVYSTNVINGAGYIVVEKYLSSSHDCASILTMKNALDCNPGPGGSYTSLLSAEADTATVNPLCAWDCTGCPGTAPHVTIGTGDGLPVELMGFEIIDGELPGDFERVDHKGVDYP